MTGRGERPRLPAPCPRSGDGMASACRLHPSGRGETARQALSSPSASAAGGISSAVREERPALPSPLPGCHRASCHPGILPEEGNSNVRGILRGEAVSANRPASAVRAGARITVLNSTNSYEILRVFFPLLAQWFTLLCSLVFTTPFSCVYYPPHKMS